MAGRVEEFFYVLYSEEHSYRLKTALTQYANTLLIQHKEYSCYFT